MKQNIDIKDIRRANTQHLINECKNTSEFAAIIGKDSSQVRQWFPSKNGDPAKKGIGNKIAKEIEVAFKKPYGWLDIDHNVEFKDEREEFITKVIRYVESDHQNLSAEDKGRLINDMLLEHERNPIHSNSILDRAISIWLSVARRK